MIIERLKRLNTQVVKGVNTLLLQLLHNPKEHRPLSLAAFSRIVREKNTTTVVARDGTKIVGMGLSFLIMKPRGRFAYIEDMVVDVAYRGQGLGERIAKKLIAIARQKGVKYVELSTRPSRVAANKLYQKLGFEQKETNVYRLRL